MSSSNFTEQCLANATPAAGSQKDLNDPAYFAISMLTLILSLCISFVIHYYFIDVDDFLDEESEDENGNDGDAEADAGERIRRNSMRHWRRHG